MLNDNQSSKLASDKRFKKVTNIGLNQFVKDILRTGKNDIKPEVSAFVKLTFVFIRGRTMRKELYKSSSMLIERFVNYELKWQRVPESIKDICESDNNEFIWMRYDEERAVCLLNRTINIFQDSSFRSLIKELSTLLTDKNERLIDLLAELHSLKEQTIFSINHRGLFDKWVKINAELYYTKNEKDITSSFINNSMKGTLGLNPPKTEEND